jgi:chorismate mutase/prephenate dehydratase
MTRKTDPATNSIQEGGRTTRPAGPIKNLRGQIDKLDLQILDLVNKRSELAASIGKAKTDQGGDVFSPAREEEVLQNVLAANAKSGGPLGDKSIRAVFREIISASRSLQKVLKVAYLGPEYSYSHLAAVERFGQSLDLLPIGVSSIMAVFEDVNRGHVDYGVVPLDNSTDGRVADTLEMFVRLPHIKICAEVRLLIHHHLLANCELAQIQRVYSKEQAISQCRGWLAKNLGQAQVISLGSTSAAAQLAHDQPHNSAAIASRLAASRYGVRILFEDIQDQPHNETRFAVICQQGDKSTSEKTGKDKTAVMFRVPHAPGTLVDALDVFRQQKINLTWIESFPSREPVGPRPDRKPKYVFFVDFEGHPEDTKVAKTLKALQEHCEDMVILGSFPMAEVSG